MITGYDKFVVAVLGAVIFALHNFFGVGTDWVSPAVFDTVVSLGTAALVYLVPNKPAPVEPMAGPPPAA